MAIFDDDIMDTDDEDELSGFEVVDREKLFFVSNKEEDEQTIATPIPENEQKALVFDVDPELMCEGAALTLSFAGDCAQLTAGGKQVCTLKAAFAAKLKETRAGMYARVTVCSVDPPMIRLQFSAGKKKGYDNKIPADR